MSASAATVQSNWWKLDTRDIAIKEININVRQIIMKMINYQKTGKNINISQP